MQKHEQGHFDKHTCSQMTSKCSNPCNILMSQCAICLQINRTVWHESVMKVILNAILLTGNANQQQRCIQGVFWKWDSKSHYDTPTLTHTHTHCRTEPCRTCYLMRIFPISLDFQHLKEFKGGRLSENVCVFLWACLRVRLDLAPDSTAAKPVKHHSAQHYCNIQSFSSDPYTQTYVCSSAYTHTHIHSLHSVPLASADSGYMATKRTDKELTTPGRLARSEKVCFAWQNLHLSSGSAREHSFHLAVPPSVFINNNNKRRTFFFSSTCSISSTLADFSRIPAVTIQARWNTIEENASCFIWTTPPVWAFLSHHWLAAGLAARIDQRVVSTGCLSQSREPSKLMNRTLWTEGGGYWCQHVFWLLPQGVILRAVIWHSWVCVSCRSGLLTVTHGSLLFAKWMLFMMLLHERSAFITLLCLIPPCFTFKLAIVSCVTFRNEDNSIASPARKWSETPNNFNVQSSSWVMCYPWTAEYIIVRLNAAWLSV